VAEADLFAARLAPPSDDPLSIVDLQQRGGGAPTGAIRVGIDRAGALPAVDPDLFDVLVTTSPRADRPWSVLAPNRLDAALSVVRRKVANAPIAATILASLLRRCDSLPFDHALEIESLAYSTLLGGSEFERWLRQRTTKEDADTSSTPVRYERDADGVVLTLDSPGNRNAMTAAMRDALCEALVNVLDDPSSPQVLLTGAGRCFSTGGHLPEFGSAGDLALAHLIRTRRSAAALIHALGERASVRLNCACIGSGIEIGVAAARRSGTADFFMQLPELGMGLVPGAGGTVTLPRAIGRHRTAWLALGGFRVGAEAALGLGLLHAIVA
jgi:hypothetical protein